MREKIDDYNHYMKTRASVRERQRQYISQFERFYRGTDTGDARASARAPRARRSGNAATRAGRYDEKDAYKMVA